MKVFLKEIAVYLLALVLLFSVLSFLFTNKGKNFNSAFVDKLQILRANRDVRKIVLLGGSSVGFSLSASQIEHGTGIKTINLGHHWGFGFIDYLPFLMQNLSKDDIIIFSPEWNFFSNPYDYDKAVLNNLIKKNYEYGELLGNRKYKMMYFLDRIDFWPNSPDTAGPYRYNCINSNGDIISHCSLKGTGASYYEISRDRLQVNDFEDVFPFLKTNRTIFLFPPTQMKVYETHSDYLKDIERALLNNKFEVMDAVKDNLYPDSAFFDAQYHLTCDGRKVRTAKVVQYLKSGKF
jgi:hypothetical protein